jgi:hypothetical protein
MSIPFPDSLLISRDVHRNSSKIEKMYPEFNQQQQPYHPSLQHEYWILE